MVCVGSELLSGSVNTHQAWLSVRLKRAGFVVMGEESVPDAVAAISAALKRALGRAEVVIVSGGLGPTFDDVTREAAASAVGRKLVWKPALWSSIRRRFRAMRYKIPEENKRQAFVVSGARVLKNPNGSAPGQAIPSGNKTIFLLPGPPAELYPMFETQVLPGLQRKFRSAGNAAEVSVRMSGIAESQADERLEAVRRQWPRGAFTILAGDGEVSFHARVFGRDAAAQRRSLRAAIGAAVGEFIHGEGEESLEFAVGRLLRERNLKLAAAESCTAGLIGARVTNVPGSSDYFLGGIIAYDNSIKTGLLGVPRALLEKYGAVSEECALAMAEGARRAARADVGLSVTGIAGPGGGSKLKPVGLVYVAVAAAQGQAVKQFNINGSRATIRQRSASAALRFLFDRLRATLLAPKSSYNKEDKSL